MIERSFHSNDNTNLIRSLPSDITADNVLFDREALQVLRGNNDQNGSCVLGDWLLATLVKADESSGRAGCSDDSRKNCASEKTDGEQKSEDRSNIKKEPDKAETVEIPSLILGQEAREDTVKRYPKDSIIAKTYDKVSPSVVKIEATRPGALKGTTDTSYGTGFFVAESGAIATNDHVFNGFEEIKVTTADGKVYKAKVLAEDKINDVALLKITPDDGKKYEPLEIEANSKSIAMQQKVMILGHANGWDKIYLSEGEVVGATSVSKVEPKPNPPEENPDKRIVAIKANGKDGGSGGPVINENGKVTGLAELASDSKRGQHVFMTLVEPLNALIDKTIPNKMKRPETRP